MRNRALTVIQIQRHRPVAQFREPMQGVARRIRNAEPVVQKQDGSVPILRPGDQGAHRIRVGAFQLKRIDGLLSWKRCGGQQNCGQTGHRSNKISKHAGNLRVSGSVN